jgi:hypothetical protein
VYDQLQEHDKFLMEIRNRLEQAQLLHKMFYHCKHQFLELFIDDWVWLCLLHRSVASFNVQGCSKLGPKYYGPFMITK